MLHQNFKFSGTYIGLYRRMRTVKLANDRDMIINNYSTSALWI